MSITAAERENRERTAAEAIHSSEMEGLTVTAQFVQDSGDYISGEIDASQLVARTRARYGLG